MAAPQRSRAEATARYLPVRSAVSVIRTASSGSSANGFSQSTCLPASRAAIVGSMWANGRGGDDHGVHLPVGEDVVDARGDVGDLPPGGELLGAIPEDVEDATIRAGAWLTSERACWLAIVPVPMMATPRVSGMLTSCLLPKGVIVPGDGRGPTACRRRAPGPGRLGHREGRPRGGGAIDWEGATGGGPLQPGLAPPAGRPRPGPLPAGAPGDRAVRRGRRAGPVPPRRLALLLARTGGVAASCWRSKATTCSPPPRRGSSDRGWGYGAAPGDGPEWLHRTHVSLFWLFCWPGWAGRPGRGRPRSPPGSSAGRGGRGCPASKPSAAGPGFLPFGTQLSRHWPHLWAPLRAAGFRQPRDLLAFTGDDRPGHPAGARSPAGWGDPARAGVAVPKPSGAARRSASAPPSRSASSGAGAGAKTPGASPIRALGSGATSAAWWSTPASAAWESAPPSSPPP